MQHYFEKLVRENFRFGRMCGFAFHRKGKASAAKNGRRRCDLERL